MSGASGVIVSRDLRELRKPVRAEIERDAVDQPELTVDAAERHVENLALRQFAAVGRHDHVDRLIRMLVGLNEHARRDVRLLGRITRTAVAAALAARGSQARARPPSS